MIDSILDWFKPELIKIISFAPQRSGEPRADYFQIQGPLVLANISNKTASLLTIILSVEDKEYPLTLDNARLPTELGPGKERTFYVFSSQIPLPSSSPLNMTVRIANSGRTCSLTTAFSP